ncbi:PREDICTED: uncharacterized protein LOC108554853 [Eufriesea mexicana]|uniref:uncharacterized protein LOC108554853 n=1 Tax=Eufriesea mexicana TaxID=516756 RepID=UPI00083C6715|nr:PREDICTED: uncharacterized protein LOC108554853 [Eufriesea mexicana]
MLGSSKEKWVGECRRELAEDADEAKIKEEGMLEQRDRIRKEKASGGDDILREAWNGREGRTRDRKGDLEYVSNYGGITLLNATYKIYPGILNILKNVIEERKLLPDTQAGFIKGRVTADNAAFDRVNRVLLWITLCEREIRKGMSKRIKEVYEGASNVVSVGETITEAFWIREGLRQGYVLSPTLFTLLIADMADELAGEHCAEPEKDLQQLMKRLEKYLEKEKLTIDAEKSKVLVSRKGGGKAKKSGLDMEGQ